LLAPILSFTCEEVWTHAKSPGGSVHLDLFPKPEELSEGITAEQQKQAADWDRLVPVRDQVLKALDTAREDKVIGSSLEASVILAAPRELGQLLEKFSDELASLFIVSQVELKNTHPDTLEVKVERARGDKCERCWKFTTDVGNDADFPTTCAACAKVLREYFN
jgi:isoleucyl-tRNA synthetase